MPRISYIISSYLKIEEPQLYESCMLRYKERCSGTSTRFFPFATNFQYMDGLAGDN